MCNISIDISNVLIILSFFCLKINRFQTGRKIDIKITVAIGSDQVALMSKGNQTQFKRNFPKSPQFTLVVITPFHKITLFTTTAFGRNENRD